MLLTDQRSGALIISTLQPLLLLMSLMGKEQIVAKSCGNDKAWGLCEKRRPRLVCTSAQLDKLLKCLV